MDKLPLDYPPDRYELPCPPAASNRVNARAPRALAPTKMFAWCSRALHSVPPKACIDRSRDPSRAPVRAVAIRAQKKRDVIIGRWIGNPETDHHLSQKRWIGKFITRAAKIVAHMERQFIDAGLQP